MSVRQTLNPIEIKKLLDDVMQGRPFNEEQLMHYHLNRNHFNVGSEVTRLDGIGDKRYRDNLGNIWTAVIGLKNWYHMPGVNYVMSNLGIRTPYSRKFLRDDNVSGLGGEFEMIIRHDGKRIDALTHESYQETYNFGRTQDWSRHKILDVNTHGRNPNYSIKVDTGRVIINELGSR